MNSCVHNYWYGPTNRVGRPTNRVGEGDKARTVTDEAEHQLEAANARIGMAKVVLFPLTRMEFAKGGGKLF
jgi:hypothetical protein